jgi:beta-lactamase class A
MPSQDLEKRNKILERRWKIMLALAIIFLITRPVALYIVNNFIHKAAEDATKNNYPLIDPARQFIPQEDYIINIQPLRTYLHGLEMQYPDQASIYYEQLNSGANISVNKNLHLFPASLSKLALALIVTKKVEEGTWSWNTKMDHTQADLSADSGEFYKSIGSDPTSVEKLLEELLVNSDNTAQNIFLRNVKIPEDYTSLQLETGLEDLYDAQGLVSAKEYSRLLRVLYTSSYLERENSEKILKLMSKANFHDYLSQSLPNGITFAHKYGENKAQSIFADAGIVYADGRPYMLTVILKGKDSTDASREWAVSLMKDISQHAYDAGKK